MRGNGGRRRIGWLAAAALLAALVPATMAAAPAAAQQFSDGYNFLKAVRDRDVGKARELLAKPGSTIVNARDVTSGETGLMIALKRRDLPWVALMLQGGADTNMKDAAGNTPLIVAAQNSFPEGAELLLSRQARVDEPNSQGETALMKTVQTNDVITAQLLLKAGADPDRPDNLTGMSAREYAARDLRGGALARLMAETPKKGEQPMVGPQL